MEPPSGKDSLPVTIEESVLSPARMKLLLLCLGLILVCAQQEENNDVALRNLDISKVESVGHSDF